MCQHFKKMIYVAVENCMACYQKCDQILEWKIARFLNVAQNVATATFILNSDVIQNGPKVAKILGYFCKQICG